MSSSESKVGGMNRADRRKIWAEVLVEALRDCQRRASFGATVVRGVIDELLYKTHAEMDQATDSDKRDKLYERHRVLSAIIQEIRDREEKEQAKEPGV